MCVCVCECVGVSVCKGVGMEKKTGESRRKQLKIVYGDGRVRGGPWVNKRTGVKRSKINIFIFFIGIKSFSLFPSQHPGLCMILLQKWWADLRFTEFYRFFFVPSTRPKRRPSSSSKSKFQSPNDNESIKSSWKTSHGLLSTAINLDANLIFDCILCFISRSKIMEVNWNQLKFTGSRLGQILR